MAMIKNCFLSSACLCVSLKQVIPFATTHWETVLHTRHVPFAPALGARFHYIALPLFLTVIQRLSLPTEDNKKSVLWLSSSSRALENAKDTTSIKKFVSFSARSRWQ